MGTPLVEIVVAWSDGPGCPSTTRMCHPWDGSEDLGDRLLSRLVAFMSDVNPYQASGLNWQAGGYLRVLDAASGDQVEMLDSSVVSGEGGPYQSDFPSQAQLCLRLLTPTRLGTRQTQGRLLIPCPTAAVSEDRSSTPSRSVMDTLAASAMAHLVRPSPEVPTSPVAVWSRTYGALSEVTLVRPDYYYTTLRSRAQR